MKTSHQLRGYNLISKIFFTAFSLLLSTVVFAQDAAKKIEVDINTNGDDDFTGSPWVWVVGAAVFILLLVALLRSSGKRTDA